MRIPVRIQLSLLLILSSSIAIAVLALAVWFVVHDYVLRVARDGLETAAALKAVELAITLELMYTACLYISTSGSLQNALKRYNNGSDTSAANWDDAMQNIVAGFNSHGALGNARGVQPGLQSQVYARNTSGPAGSKSVLNVTGAGDTAIELPWRNSNGGVAHLGIGSSGYPPSLYPNLTISGPQSQTGSYLATYENEKLGLGSNLVLGPLTINNSFSLLSMTIPVVDNNSEANILGWITIVQDTRLIDKIVEDETGLGKTGVTALFGPTHTTNRFVDGGTGAGSAGQREVQLLFPISPSRTSVHPSYTSYPPFEASAFPAVESAIADGFHGRRELGSLPNTHNEESFEVSVAYSTPPIQIVDWIVVVQQARSEFWAPVNELRTIILACFFSVMGFFFLVSLPIAHWAVRPITRLRAATQSAIDPLFGSSSGSLRSADHPTNNDSKRRGSVITINNGVVGAFFQRLRRRRPIEENQRQAKRFRIPSKVDTSKHWIKDDLSDLMMTFNEMSDELFLQYSKLEERVAQRTIELDQSKRAAEAANESKTLFVANVSHELKTPLNGILGMCATSIEEDDMEQMKTSLSIIYRSGDLLLRTLNDLLLFSANQVGGQSLALEEREFTLHDIETQILTIFDQQAIDKSINLRFQCIDATSNSLSASAGLRDMTLWGDIHRTLQIIINLVSNSMKYTPEKGSVICAVRKSNELAPRRLPRALEQASLQSKGTRSSVARRSERGGTANFINPTEGHQLQERSCAPPGDDLYFEFEVRDTGQGIPEEMQSRIFEPFVQGEVGLNRRHSGTGLGLSICSQLATLMRGSISLQSTPGQGSTFTVKVPLRHVLATPSRNSIDRSINSVPKPQNTSSVVNGERVDEKDMMHGAIEDRVVEGASPDPENTGIAQPPALTTIMSAPEGKATENDEKPAKAFSPSPEREPSSPKTTKSHHTSRKSHEASEKHDFSKLRVLVAEDNKVNQQVILRMLKMEQILQVAIAEDGQQALDLVKTKTQEHTEDEETAAMPYDLIFMDIQMPNMDGISSTRLIRESGFEGPIVALTAYAEQKNVDDCYESGMNHFLAKPLKKPQLREALIRLCSENLESKES